MTDKQPGVKASGPAGSRLLTLRDMESRGKSLFEQLFGSRDTGSYDRLVCGPGRRNACIEVERGRER